MVPQKKSLVEPKKLDGRVSQFVARYARAQGYILEVGASGKALTYAMGGQYYDLGSPEMAFQPLRDIDDEQARRWAHEWVQDRFTERTSRSPRNTATRCGGHCVPSPRPRPGSGPSPA